MSTDHYIPIKGASLKAKTTTTPKPIIYTSTEVTRPIKESYNVELKNIVVRENFLETWLFNKEILQK